MTKETLWNRWVSIWDVLDDPMGQDLDEELAGDLYSCYHALRRLGVVFDPRFASDMETIARASDADCDSGDDDGA